MRTRRRSTACTWNSFGDTSVTPQTAEAAGADDPRDRVDVVVVGAGPVGLTLANILGGHGVRTLVVEERDTLIDYPRGVGLDDESLRAFQAIGLVDAILPHTVPNQILRFFDRRRRLLAEMAPADACFGWPKRNGFVQPLVDAELLRGLDRFDHVQVAWGQPMTGCTETADGVTVHLPDRSVDAGYLVGCDGGRSATRRLMGVSFDGTTSSTRWLVVDIANDPLGHPNSEVGADPARPYASISIAHGIRRFEFMIHPDETDEQVDDRGFVAAMLAPFVPRPHDVDIIRHRVYTHHSRIAGAFRAGRLLLAGDAAHLMPVWQGQGYNSGIRDALNLGWKLAAVVRGQARETLLDSYDVERRKHARAMIDLSTMVGRVISPTNSTVATLRDAVIRAASVVPTLKRYVLQMRFKPMPRYDHGAVVHHRSPRPDSPVGTLFIQPRVATRAHADVLLDEVLGPGFAVLCWNNDPRALLGAEAFARWKAVGARFIAARPQTQLHWRDPDAPEDPDVTVVGDRTGELKAWFDRHTESVLFVRPDRCIAAACIAQRAAESTERLFAVLALVAPGGDLPDDAGRVLHVAQSAAESAGTAG
ncbi:bifunctional 3-(3-hydroxy-phenyl)propionate/3-hydroxycinnamic acid hydroxylase [Mycolicibacillus parakoreensis]|nr:bifunctional 3-(3-hydroxy-phenyl)propionate/3-hydroxycinnamic acid hydroxylase [Mycolicibacillus parakoreensis]